MDLLGRKAKAQLEVALDWLVATDARLQAADLERRAKDRIIEKLREHIFRLEAKVYAPPIPAAPISHLRPVGDEEEELQYALRNGDIDKTEFKDLLEQAGFENTEVEIPTRAERPIIY
jgi:hypothetical protein